MHATIALIAGVVTIGICAAVNLSINKNRRSLEKILRGGYEDVYHTNQIKVLNFQISSKIYLLATVFAIGMIIIWNFLN